MLSFTCADNETSRGECAEKIDRLHHREFGDEELSVDSGTKTVFAAHAHF